MPLSMTDTWHAEPLHVSMVPHARRPVARLVQATGLPVENVAEWEGPQLPI